MSCALSKNLAECSHKCSILNDESNTIYMLHLHIQYTSTKYLVLSWYTSSSQIKGFWTTPLLTKRGAECTKDPWLANFKMGTHVHIMLNISLLLFFIWWSMFHIVLVLNVWYHYTTCYIMSLNVWLVHACTFPFTFFSQIFPKILKY